MGMNTLLNQHSKPLPAGTPALSQAEIAELLKQVAGWAISNGLLTRTFRFGNFHETMAFVNAVAWVAHREDHHPDLEVGYNRCTVKYSTHSVGGLSKNDFICAAKVDGLGVG
jgi:4a-hydroxytetrahydrobiopterin dehydratase